MRGRVVQRSSVSTSAQAGEPKTNDNDELPSPLRSRETTRTFKSAVTAIVVDQDCDIFSELEPAESVEHLGLSASELANDHGEFSFSYRNQKQQELNCFLANQVDQLSTRLNSFILKKGSHHKKQRVKTSLYSAVESPLSITLQSRNLEQQNVSVPSNYSALENITEKPEILVSDEEPTAPKPNFFRIKNVETFKMAMIELFKGNPLTDFHENSIVENSSVVLSMLERKFKRPVNLPQRVKDWRILIRQFSIDSKRNQEKLKFVAKKVIKDLRKDLIVKNSWSFKCQKTTEKFYDFYFPGENLQKFIKWKSPRFSMNCSHIVDLMSSVSFRTDFVSKLLSIDFRSAVEAKMINWIDNLDKMHSRERSKRGLKKLPWTVYEIDSAVDFFKEFICQVVGVEQLGSLLPMRLQ